MEDENACKAALAVRWDLSEYSKNSLTEITPEIMPLWEISSSTLHHLLDKISFLAFVNLRYRI